MLRWMFRAVAETLLLLAALFIVVLPCRSDDAPSWPASSIVYTIYPSIFSPKGDFAGVTAQLGRLKDLGVTVVWLMPVTPIGQPINGHPSFGSPYCVHNYMGVNPAYGPPSDLKALVATAHKLGLKVILDEVLNHTAWDNPLITQHPEFYAHSDGDPKNPATIRQAFSYGDVAQLNYANPSLRTYMIGMLQSWLTEYGVDGFRFDAASSPDGPDRKIPADFWQDLGRQLHATKPDVLLLGECETPDLAQKPFALDYGWWLLDALKTASWGGDASQVQAAWQRQTDGFPPDMKHLAMQDNWDSLRDTQIFGGTGGARTAAAFNLTGTGIPLIYNGMEIGNAGGGVNPHEPIDWAGGDPRFPEFYRQLIALRRKNPALTTGAMTWLPNSAPSHILTYERTGGGTQFLIEINLSPKAAQGTFQASLGSGWTPVPITDAPSVTPLAPPQINLPPKSFAIFRRSVKSP